MTDPQHRFMTQAEYARARGLTGGRVSQMKTEGKLILSLDGLIDVEQTDALLSLTADSRGRPRGGSDQREARQAGVAVDTSKAKKAFYDAEMARIDYEERCRRLVPVSEMRRAIADATTVFRSAMEALPAQLSPVLAGKDESHVQAVLTEYIERNLEDLAGRFTQIAKRSKPTT